jgi:hypothetical protein
MRRFSFVHFALAATVIATMLESSVAHAQINQTFVAANGPGTTCTRSAPCSTFAAAYTATSIGGEIVCLDSGFFGAFNINHSITVNCTGTNGNVNNATVAINTAATDVVVLKGMDFDVNGATANGVQSGLISFNGAGVLHVENTRFNSIKGDRYSGILFTPSGPAKLIVSDSTFTNIGTAGVAAGIYIKPASGVTTDVSIERSRIDSNFFGIVADGTSGGFIRGIVSDSFVTNNRHNGITVSTSGTSVVLTVDNTKISGNNFGLVVAGTNGGMLVGRSVINGNATGLYSSGGAALLSYKDNRLNGNTTTDGAFTGSVNTQ